MRSGSTIAYSLLLLAALGRAEQARRFEDPADRASYSLGHQIGSDLRREGREVDVEALRRGIREGLAGKAPALPQEEMDALVVGLKKSILATRGKRRQEIGAERRAAGSAFLAANAKKDGVTVLGSGLQYRVIETGTGTAPAAGDRVRVHYRSTLIDGTVFHDSRARGGAPETLRVDGVIRGLGEALQRMQPGARWKLFIPPDLAFGRRGPLADHTVIYDVELIALEEQP